MIAVALITAASAATWIVGQDGPTVQATIDRAVDGDTVVVPDGTWPGPARVERAITLTSRGGIIDGGGVGRVITVSAPGVVVDHVIVRASGTDLTHPDACVYVEHAAIGAIVRDSDLTACLFGVWVHQGDHVQVVGNHVAGRPDLRVGDRGNGIHLFDGSHLIVSDNTVEGTRDGIYVSATDDSTIDGNHASNVRYGIHYMYSLRNTVSGNVTTHDTGGIALMESRDLVVEDNVSTDNTNRGILFRDAQFCTIRHNTVERNGEGLFFFSSVDNLIEGNTIAHNDVGARVWAGTERNVVRGNAFIGNRQQLFYVAAADEAWGDDTQGNYWSDYLGWDQDGDGRGDRPYRADSFAAKLLYRYPQAVLLLGSPSLELLIYLEARLPALRVASITDAHPMMEVR